MEKASGTGPGQEQAQKPKVKKKPNKTTLRDVFLFLFAFVVGIALFVITSGFADPALGCGYQCLPATFQYGIVFSVIVASIGGIILAVSKKNNLGRLAKVLATGGAGFLAASLFYFLALSGVSGESYRIPMCTPTPTLTPVAPAATPTPAPALPVINCPGPADFTFEDGTSGNWLIRIEGEKRMGESLKYSNAVECAGKPVHSLEYTFQLGPEHGAQIGLDGKGVPLVEGLSAWLYTPEDAPDSLAVRCFVMEGESREYAWYETEPKPLSPGEWIKISCPINGFHWVESGDGQGWQNPPLFIGLGFLDTQDKPYLGKVYLSSVDIK